MGNDYTMSLAPVELDTAAPKAKALLEQAKVQVGFIPNMYGGMANSPGMLATYMDGYARFRADSGFTSAEQEVVLLTVSRSNACTYCMAAHSMIADRMSQVPPIVTHALRAGQTLPDTRLAGLSTFTDVMLTTRGRPTREDVAAFLAAGYTEPQILAIVLAIAVKTISNYSNHLFHTTVDPMFAQYAWQPPD